MDFLTAFALELVFAICGQDCVIYDVPAAIKAAQAQESQPKEEHKNEYLRTDQ